MAEYHINNPEDLIECPYNKSHMIRACRMQYHLMKCRKQHDATEFVACPFNARHEVYRVEARYHQAICPDRHRIAHGLSHLNEDSDSELKGCTDLPAYTPKWPYNHGGESWEDDIPSNPRVGVDMNLLERGHGYHQPTAPSSANTPGLTALERREQYLKQKKDESRTGEEDVPQLRRPHNPSQAYAIHMQQQQQQQQVLQQQQQRPDIYQLVLQRQREKSACLVGAGRGSSLAGSDTGQPSVNGAQAMVPRAGLGRGLLSIRPGMPGVLGRGDGNGGRGVAAVPSAVGRGTAINNLRPSFATHCSELTSQPSPGPAFAAGRGESLALDNVLSSVSGQNTQSLGGQGQGVVMPVVGGLDVEEEEEDDEEQFLDAPSWVGGGYYNSPVKTASQQGTYHGLAMGNAPGSYPHFVLQTSDGSVSDRSSALLSESDTSVSTSTEETQRSLKKVRKTLRQIETLEQKRSRGMRLNTEEENKVGRKWALKAEEEDLQNRLEVLSVD